MVLYIYNNSQIASNGAFNIVYVHRMKEMEEEWIIMIRLRRNSMHQGHLHTIYR